MAAQQNKQEQPVQPRVRLRLQRDMASNGGCGRPMPSWCGRAAVVHLPHAAAAAARRPAHRRPGSAEQGWPARRLRWGSGSNSLPWRSAALRPWRPAPHAPPLDLILDSCISLNCAIYVSSEVCSWDSGVVELVKGLICFLSSCEGFLFYGWCQQSAHLLVHRPVFALL